MRKQHFQRLLACLMAGAGIAWVIHDWFVVNQGPRYFAGDGRRVIALLVIVVIGAPILLGYGALSTERRRWIDLWVVGLIAAGASVFAIYSAYAMARLGGFLFETGNHWMGLIAVIVPSVVAASLWWAFRRQWQGKPV